MRKILTVLVATAALGAVASQPAAAATTCTLAPPTSYIVFKQSNGWTTVLPVQVGNSISGGAATYFGTWDRDTRVYGGDAQGVIVGRQFRITAYWDNGSAGIYTGTVDRDGFVTGVARDRFNPGLSATFRSTRRAICR